MLLYERVPQIDIFDGSYLSSLLIDYNNQTRKQTVLSIVSSVPSSVFTVFIPVLRVLSIFFEDYTTNMKL